MLRIEAEGIVVLNLQRATQAAIDLAGRIIRSSSKPSSRVTSKTYAISALPCWLASPRSPKPRWTLARFALVSGDEQRDVF
jgi:hypothetical protein